MSEIKSSQAWIAGAGLAIVSVITVTFLSVIIFDSDPLPKTSNKSNVAPGSVIPIKPNDSSLGQLDQSNQDDLQAAPENLQPQREGLQEATSGSAYGNTGDPQVLGSQTQLQQ